MNNRSTDQTSLPAGPRAARKRTAVGTARCDCPAHRSAKRKTTRINKEVR